MKLERSGFCRTLSCRTHVLANHLHLQQRRGVPAPPTSHIAEQAIITFSHGKSRPLAAIRTRSRLSKFPDSRLWVAHWPLTVGG